MPEKIAHLPVPELIERREFERRQAAEAERAAEKKLMHKERKQVHARRTLVGLGFILLFGLLVFRARSAVDADCFSFLLGCAVMYTVPHLYKFDVHSRHYYEE